MEGRPWTKTRSRESLPGPRGLGQMKGGAHGRAHGDMVDVSARVGIKAMCGGLGMKQSKTKKGQHDCLGLTTDSSLLTEPARQQWFSNVASGPAEFTSPAELSEMQILGLLPRGNAAVTLEPEQVICMLLALAFEKLPGGPRLLPTQNVLQSVSPLGSGSLPTGLF